MQFKKLLRPMLGILSLLLLICFSANAGDPGKSSITLKTDPGKNPEKNLVVPQGQLEEFLRNFEKTPASSIKQTENGSQKNLIPLYLNREGNPANKLSTNITGNYVSDAGLDHITIVTETYVDRVRGTQTITIYPGDQTKNYVKGSKGSSPADMVMSLNNLFYSQSNSGSAGSTGSLPSMNLIESTGGSSSPAETARSGSKTTQR